MINRAFRRKNKTELPTAPEPRSLEAIKEEYQQVSAAAISSQYQIYVHERALREFNDKMYNLNQEASARQKLDTPVVAPEVSNVQS